MFINELLCKLIVEKNPGRDVYLEESYPLKSFYPQSVPHGFVLKINRQPVDLSKAAIKADRKFWADQTRKLVGKVIGDNTTINELCAWSEGILVRSNFSNFAGNKAYLKDRQAPQYFSNATVPSRHFTNGGAQRRPTRPSLRCCQGKRTMLIKRQWRCHRSIQKWPGVIRIT